MPEDPALPPISERSTLDQAGPSPAGSFGRYRLLQRLGEGGMGEVWLAEQTEPVRRQVALKVIKAGMDSAQVVARFEAERQALALMDHPAIATVFDGGTTPEGRPYFVMEYVKGEPITAYCDRHRLSTRERLELFTQVCDGVQHAHQKGIIHRDLKPSNVLVHDPGRPPGPKIIDFGVAKATAQHLTERTLFTELGVLIGTPEYMSPEQAEMGGLDIDTRTDIYALGVLLYELLTGALPFDRKELRQAGLAEIQQIIREKEPPRPSTRHHPARRRPRRRPRRTGSPSRAGSSASCAGTWTGSRCGRWRRTGPADTRRPTLWQRTCAATWATNRCRRDRRAPPIGRGSSCGGIASGSPPPSRWCSCWRLLPGRWPCRLGGSPGSATRPGSPRGRQSRSTRSSSGCSARPIRARAGVT